MRRTLRILPLYYSVLLLHVVVLPRIDQTIFSSVYVVPADRPEFEAYRSSLWAYFVFLQNYIVDVQDLRLGLGIFWSLAVEERFYLFWPVALVLLASLRWRGWIPAFSSLPSRHQW